MGPRSLEKLTGTASSPAASGPAGSHFEGQVGAYYLLSMLAGAEPRGLPGTNIERVEFQRGAEGHPLDDVIVHAHDGRSAAVLEIQVKRTITFAPGDTVFKAVVDQIAEASRKPEFDASRYELAIATSRSSQKIDGPYQDVLTWARQIGDAATFAARIERKGSANDDMRRFVHTFKAHLGNAGVSADDENVWRLLRRLHILVFDFTAPGSASRELAFERAVSVLHSDDSSRGAELWSVLIDTAIETAASGGDRNRETLAGELGQRSFRLSGERRFSSARAAIAEASRHALEDIHDRVGDVMLMRHAQVTEVREALDRGRYVEIRGDAGVGKSGVLKHFARQIQNETQVFVLSPTRTLPGGWLAMRGTLGFDGSARELLSDMVGDGAAIIFIDNLDFFPEDKRTTVRDLVRETSEVPGVSVITTVRRDFGKDEQNWLPKEALSRLGYATPVIIQELRDTEVDELRSLAPNLISLLAESHPARDVTRNLFRLDRLVSLGGDEHVPRTEFEMARQWWLSADGHQDAAHRERRRLLKKLAEQAISQVEPFDVSGEPAPVVNALVSSETLRDLGGDKVTFRHDVLREWAIANLLYDNLTLIDTLPLQHPAPPALARGTELAARATLESAADSAGWQSLLESLSRDGIHGSWRRTALLALVRSERAGVLLQSASVYLFSDSAYVLRELLRTVIAVEVQQANPLLTDLGLDPDTIPAGFSFPTSLSWPRLIGWLLTLGDALPNAAIPDVVDLYTTWSGGMFGQDALTPSILHYLYHWLTEIESAREGRTVTDFRTPFGGEVEQLRTLESELRAYFLVFSNRVPELAAQYLRELGQRRHSEEAKFDVVQSSGMLAQAAPHELAELTLAALVPEPDPDDEHFRDEYQRPFDWHDSKFLPASPAQGPFFALLTHAPAEGKRVVEQLVEHAVSFYTEGREPGDNTIDIELNGGVRRFPWMRTYTWSRDGEGNYCLTSALMALEAWAHHRIEAGEKFETVLADVLGPPSAPAAYLLIAVDLILSHWPKSREAAIPFLASPELLCIDNQRLAHDDFDIPDIFGIKDLQKEPKGTVSLDSLKQRPSRRASLDNVLGHYAVYPPSEQREKLAGLLRKSAERLGQPKASFDLGDPALMAVHALNQIDPANWKEVPIEMEDGSVGTAHQYVPPPAEAAHFAAFEETVRNNAETTTMQAYLGLILDDPSRSSPEATAAAVRWAQDNESTQDDGKEDAAWVREQAILAAAMSVMRDGDDTLRRESADWAQGVFAQAFAQEEDRVHRVRGGLRFNPPAIAFVGMVHAVKHGVTTLKIRDLLDIAASGNAAAAQGLRASAAAVAEIDERLPRALVRCAFASCVRPNTRWDTPEDEAEELSKRRRQRMDGVLQAEADWLAGTGDEPDWPEFPPQMRRTRRVFRLPGGRAEVSPPVSEEEPPDIYVDHQAAALWLNGISRLFDTTANPWLREIAVRYMSWTAGANGAGLEVHEEITDTPHEWNDAFLHLIAVSLPGMTMPEIHQQFVEPMCSLPDEPFFDILAPLLRRIDEVYFNDSILDESIALALRAAFAERMMQASGWRYLAGKRSASVEVHIGPAISVLFFGESGFGVQPRSYLLSKAVNRLGPFLPVLSKLIRSAPSLSVAIVTVNLLEVSPRPQHLAFVIDAAKTWLEAFPDDSDFWVDYGIGRPICAWLEAVLHQDPDLLVCPSPLRNEVDRILSALVSLGIAEAHRLEEAITTAPEKSSTAK